MPLGWGTDVTQTLALCQVTVALEHGQAGGHGGGGWGRVLPGRGHRMAEHRPWAPGRAQCAAEDSVEIMQGTPKARPHRASLPRSTPPDWGPSLRGPRGSREPSVFAHVGRTPGDRGLGAAGMKVESDGAGGAQRWGQAL